MCLVNPPPGDGIMISVRFPGSKTQMLTVKCCGLYSTVEWMQLLFEDYTKVVSGLTCASVRY